MPSDYQSFPAECGHTTDVPLHCTSSRCAGKSYCPKCYELPTHPCFDPCELELA